MRRLPKMAAALLAAALAVSAALPALAADQRAELELEASVRCTGEAADETLTVRLTALDGAPMPEGCDDEAELNFPARDCRTADDKTLTKTFDTIVYTAPGIYEYTVTQDAGGRKRADYDDTVFYLKVMVAWDTDGELKGHVSVRRDGDPHPDRPAALARAGAGRRGYHPRGGWPLAELEAQTRCVGW